MHNNKKKYTWFANQPIRSESIDLEPERKLTRTKSVYELEGGQGQISPPRKSRIFGSTLEVPKKDLPGSLEETDRDSIMPEQFRVPPNLAELLLSELSETEKDELIPLYDRQAFNTFEDHEAPKEEFNWEEEAARDSVSSTRPIKDKYLRHSEDSMREYSELKLMIDWNTDENTGPTGMRFEPRAINGSKMHGSGRESIDSKKVGERRNSKGERFFSDPLPATTPTGKLKSVTPDRKTRSSQMSSNQYSSKIYEDYSLDKGKSSVGGVRYHPESSYEPYESDGRTKKSCNMRMNSEITTPLDQENTTLSQQFQPLQVLPPDNSVPQGFETLETLMCRSDGSEITQTFTHHKCAQRKIYQERSREKFLNERKKRDSYMGQKETCSSRITDTSIKDHTPHKPEQIIEVNKLPDNEIRAPDIAKSDPETSTPSLSSKRTKSRLQELDSKTLEAPQTASGIDPKPEIRRVDSAIKILEGNKVWSRPPDKGKLPIPYLVSNQNYGAKSQLQSSVYRDLYEDKYLYTQRDSAYKPPKNYYKSYLNNKQNRAKSTRNATKQYPPVQPKSNLKWRKDTMNDSVVLSRFSQVRHNFNSTISEAPRRTVASVGSENRQESMERREWSESEKESSLHEDDEWQWPKEGTGNRKCRALKNRK